MSFLRRAGAEIAGFLASLIDPVVDADAVQVYAKDVDGVLQLFAESSDGTVYQLTPTADPATGVGVGFDVFGSGLDGDLDFDGTPVTLNATPSTTLAEVAGVYTLQRDLYASNINLRVGRIINPNGWRIFCTGTFTISGTVRSNGGNGGNGAAGVGGAAGAAAIVTPQVYNSTRAGVAGANAGAASAAGLGATVLGGVTTNAAAGANGGRLQGGGGGTANFAGGVGTGASFTVANMPSFNSLATAIQGRDLNQSRIGSAGSGGGGSGSAGGGGGSGGGSGAAGGTIGIFAKFITGVGSITANGGNGGNGGGTLGGGGGGGGGGLICTATGSKYPLPVTVSVAGGAGGTPAGAGAAGGNGGDGVHYQFSIPVT